MNSNDFKKFTFNMEDDKGEHVVKGEIIGETEIPFFDDLKLKAVIALLNSIDRQHFQDLGKMDLFNDYITEIKETINEMKKYNHFQGKIE